MPKTPDTAKPIPLFTPSWKTGKAKLGSKALTAQIIAAMRPGDELADPKSPGLRVSGSSIAKVFFYRYRFREKLRQIKLGEFGPLTLSDARARWMAERAKVLRGEDPQDEKQKARQAVKNAALEAARRQTSTCAAVVETYLLEIEANRKSKGAAEARRMLERAIAGREAQDANTLTKVEAGQIIKRIAKSARRVAQMTRQELRACWDHALDNGLISSSANPFRGKNVGGKFESKARSVTLDAAEIGALLRWMREPGTYSRTVSDALELTLRTGLRSGEVCGIHSNEVVEKEGVLWLEIPANRMKEGRPHSVPLVGRAAAIVETRIGEGGYLFASRSGGPIDQKVLGVEVYSCSGRSASKTYAKRKACPVIAPKKWPDNPWAPHDLRRTARTFLADLGCPFEVGEAILAHKLPGVASTYNQSEYRPEKILWLTRLNEYLDKLQATKNLVGISRRVA